MNSVTDVILLEFRASFGELRIAGPSQPRYGTLTEEEPQGTLRIERSGTPMDADTPIQVLYRRSEDDVTEWSIGQTGGPVLFEHTTYTLYATGSDALPTLQHRDLGFLNRIENRPRDRVLVGTFNLQGQIGLVDLAIQFGTETVTITLEVIPTKLDYASDYLRLIEDVEQVVRGMALAYVRSTYQVSDATDKPNTVIEWLTILRQRIASVQHALEYVDRSPYRHLARNLHMQTCYKVKKPDATLRRAVARGKGSGSFEIAGDRRIRSNVPSTVARTTLDTPEHRWIRCQLSDIEHRLQTILTELTTGSSVETTKWPRVRQTIEQLEVENMLSRISRMLESRCLAGASPVVKPAPPSLTLLNAPGYREIHQILYRLRSSLTVDDGTLQLHIKDLPELYQLWCYLRIVNILTTMTNDLQDVGSLVHSTYSGIQLSVAGGKSSSISFEMAPYSQRLTVSYQRRFHGETGTQEPDIVLQVERLDGTFAMVVLDAKYRLDATREYINTHHSPGPPKEAIDSLHRYRDAIVDENDGLRVRPVVKGVALFPLSRNYNDAFKKNPLYSAVETIGIGALPFLPDNAGLVEEWLHDVLELPSDKLVFSGPPRP